MKRILTTHVGSLPRPHDLLDMMKTRLSGAAYDQIAYDAKVRDAVFDIVAKQVECGIDIVADGEQSKPGFFTYVRERLSGFEPRPGMKVPFFEAEVSAFPEYYKDYFARAMGGGGVAPIAPMVCVGPVSYTGREALARDIQNLKDALVGRSVVGAFMPSIAPSGAGLNEYYRTEGEFYHAVSNALREEYKAIVDAGFFLQIDDPFLSDVYSDLRYDDAQKNRKAGLFVEALNHALEGIPEEKVRFHTWYGINEGPRSASSTPSCRRSLATC
jgi:5-methyltetrahydropteroyltriglutamate--homocysteine methyltransferase